MICSHNSVITTYCFDEEKISVFRDNWNDTAERKRLYTALLGTSEIYIEEVWPRSYDDYGEDYKHLIYNNTRSGNYTKLSTKEEIAYIKYLFPEKAKFTPI